MRGVTPRAQIRQLALDDNVSAEPADVWADGTQMSGYTEVEGSPCYADFPTQRRCPKTFAIGLKRRTVGDAAEKAYPICTEELEPDMRQEGVAIVSVLR